MKFFLVGGACRDEIMGKQPKDWDFAVENSTPEEMTKLYGEPVGNDFPVWLGRVTGYEDLGVCELALCRKETSTGNKHTDFAFDFGPGVTIEEDLARRDFTANAIAKEIETGQIIDPYNGRKDIEDKVLRVVNPKAFIEDGLRVFRLARFSAQLKFNIAPETLKLAQKIDTSGITIERIWKEIRKALASDDPPRFFDALRATGHLKQFFPELAQMYGVPQAHHDECAYTHTMMVLREGVKCGLPEMEMFALLCHDLGKGTTPKEELPKHIGHDQRSMELAKRVGKRWKVPTKHIKFAVWFAENHMRLHWIPDMNLGKIVKMADQMLNSNYSIFSIMEMAKCDEAGRTGEKEDMPPTDISKLARAYAIIPNIHADEFVEKGFKGKQIGELLHQKRVNALRKALEAQDEM
jgi:tRNA nucleotidyltransferase (CCA-adding enzyme)